MDTVIGLLDTIEAAELGYCDPAASDEVVDAHVVTWGNAMEKLAKIPGRTKEIRTAKARALRTAVTRYNGSVPVELAGDQGLAASFVFDMLTVSQKDFVIKTQQCLKKSHSAIRASDLILKRDKTTVVKS